MRNPIIALKGNRTSGQHAGLLLQRYLCEKATGDGGNPAEKRAILQAAIDAAANKDVQALYQIAFDRWSASLPDEPGSISLATQGRLIVGLGSENVLETGIRLHHTYGMPVIPGSALKGLSAHYCDQVWGATCAKYKKGGTYHQLLFGTTEDSGCILFHDAWLIMPGSPRPLVLDVMTPHHPGWNDVKDPVAPTDFDSPTPVPFLSVTGKFLIAVSWHGPEHKEAAKWTKRALELLCDALCDWGVGGKTTSGYGRLVDPRHSRLLRNNAGGSVTPSSEVANPSGNVRVRFVGPHDALRAPQQAYWVQEEGRKRGLVKYGQVPKPLPAEGSEIEVYPTNNNPNSPEYRWDPPPPKPQKGGPGSRPIRGRR